MCSQISRVQLPSESYKKRLGCVSYSYINGIESDVTKSQISLKIKGESHSTLLTYTRYLNGILKICIDCIGKDMLW